MIIIVNTFLEYSIESLISSQKLICFNKPLFFTKSSYVIICYKQYKDLSYTHSFNQVIHVFVIDSNG